MRAAILARGLATRMRKPAGEVMLDDRQAAAADAGLKSLIPIGGRPFLDFVISHLADAGVTDVGLIIGPEHDVVRDYYGTAHPPRRVRLSFLTQETARGTADAVLACEAWAGTAPFLVVNADNLYPVDVLCDLIALPGPGLPAFERDDLVRTSNIPPDRILAFALVEADAHGRLVRIIEKPGAEVVRAAGPRASVSMNCWKFDATIFDACRAVTPSVRGELELPQAVQLAVDTGVTLQTVRAHGPVLDLSQRSDIAEVVRRLGGEMPDP